MCHRDPVWVVRENDGSDETPLLIRIVLEVISAFARLAVAGVGLLDGVLNMVNCAVQRLAKKMRLFH